MSQKEELIKDYKFRMDGSEKERRNHNGLAIALYALAIGTSVLASALSGLTTVPREIVALIAVIPAGAAGVLGVFKPDAVSGWWAAKYSKLDDLVQALKYEDMSASDASKEFARFMQKHDTRYPGWGTAPSA